MSNIIGRKCQGIYWKV